MKKRILPILFILIGLSSLTAKAQKEVTVRLNPKTGVTYNATIKNTMMNLMEVQGQNISSTQSLETKCSFSAKEVSSNEITIEGQNDAMKLTISQMGMKLTYDSEHPENTSPMLAGQTDDLETSLKKPYTVKFDALGHRIEEKEEAEMPLINSVIVQLPEEPMSVGSTWTTSQKQDVSGTEIDATMTYTVTKISKKSVEITVNGTVKGGEEASGTYEGTASIDPQTGLVTKSSIKQSLSMTISQQGMTFPVTINGTTTVTMEN